MNIIFVIDILFWQLNNSYSSYSPKCVFWTARKQFNIKHFIEWKLQSFLFIFYKWTPNWPVRRFNLRKKKWQLNSTALKYLEKNVENTISVCINDLLVGFFSILFRRKRVWYNSRMIREVREMSATFVLIPLNFFLLNK